MPILYRHIRLDKNEPFYIGIGINEKRAYDLKRNNIWKSIVKKTEYIVEIVYHHNDINFIKIKEEEFIKLYGRIDKNSGTLANMTNGGESNGGRIVSEETKNLLSKYCGEKASFWGKKHSEEIKKQISLKTKDTKRKGISDETRQKMSIAQKSRKSFRSGFKLSDETRDKISKAKKGKIGHPMSELLKAKVSASKKDYWLHNKHKHLGDNNVSKREDVRAKLRVTSSGINNGMYGKIGELNHFYGKKHNIESLKKMSDSRKGKCLGDENASKRPQVREKIRQKKIEYWQNIKKQKMENKTQWSKITHVKSTMPSKDTEYALFIGRWQPLHLGHKELFNQVLNEGNKVCIAIRDVEPDEKNPFTSKEVFDNISEFYKNNILLGQVKVIIIPSINSVSFGRGVGYDIIEYIPPAEIADISATKIREEMRKKGES